jgi:hypothetical protein
MAVTTDAIIFEALQARLRTMPGVLPIAGPNVTFPAAGQTKPDKYLKVDFLPNRTRQVTLGDDPQQKIGIMQVSVMWPVGRGILDGLEVAGAIVNRFKNETLFASDVRITISSEPWAASPLQDTDRLMIPVSIPYIAFEPEA